MFLSSTKQPNHRYLNLAVLAVLVAELPIHELLMSDIFINITQVLHFITLMVPKEEEVGEERVVTINCFEYETKSLEHLLRFLDQVKCLLHENGLPQDFNSPFLGQRRIWNNGSQIK